MALFARRGSLVDCYRVAAAQAAVALLLVYALSTVFRFYGFSEEATGCANDEDVWQLPVPPLASSSRHLLTADKNQSVISRVSAVTSSEILTFLRRTSDCPTVDAIGGRVFLASGWTKAVFSGVQDGRDVAVKVVDNTGHDIQECRKKRGEFDGASAAEKCRQSAERKLVKEAFVLRLLNSPHIVQILNHCIPPEAGSPVTLVTELGENADIIKLLQKSWEDRLKIAYGISNLIFYLANNEFGSIVINDFRRQQFIIVDGDVKLTDVDDVSFEEPTCMSDEDCLKQLREFQSDAPNETRTVRCDSGRCSGLNEIKNILNAGQHFMSIFLPHGTPTLLRPLVNEIVSAHKSAALRTDELLRLMRRLIDEFSNGNYLQRNSSEPVQLAYTKLTGSDLPGKFDYRCRYSIATSVCTVSVHDVKEAEDLCEFDDQCVAFVLSNKKTWTGRLIAHLKNNITRASIASHNHGNDLYYKSDLETDLT